jgi:CubicO group peptidase (beta-lactamase class C family)
MTLVRASLIAVASLATACSVSSSSPDEAPSEGTANLTALDRRFFDTGVTDDDVFAHANPDPAKVDLVAIDKMLADAQASGSESAIVALGDTIIAEKYFGHTGDVTSVQSVTKSVTSLLIGILMDQGRIRSLDEPMSTWYPDWRNDGPKSRVTLRHVVTMTAGITDFPSPTGTHPDWLAYLASRPLAWEPGTQFTYSTFGAYLLTGVVKEASRMAVDDFARANLFAPLGITDWRWFKDAQGNTDTGGGLYLRPRDMLRIGRLVREGGVWKGHRIVSSEWLAESARTESPLFPCYAMEWWVLRDGCDASTGAEPTLGPNEGFYADGYGGQYITVVPSTTMLGVRTTTPPVDVSEAEYLRINFGAFPHEIAKLTGAHAER